MDLGKPFSAESIPTGHVRLGIYEHQNVLISIGFATHKSAFTHIQCTPHCIHLNTIKIELKCSVQVPVGRETLGRIINVLGEPVDEVGPIGTAPQLQALGKDFLACIGIPSFLTKVPFPWEEELKDMARYTPTV